MLTRTFQNNKLIILFTILSLQNTNCFSQTKKADPEGKYESKSSNSIYRFLNINQVNNKIEIRKDSTYVYETCANRISGYWKVSNDSLFLYCTENKYQIDSLNIVGYNGKKKLTCWELPDILVMSNGKLYEDIKLSGIKKTIHLVYEKKD